MLNVLDLFSGIGGISIALENWVKPVAYCENDRYAQSILLSRMADGLLVNAPIWDDVRTITGKMLPAVDMVYGGFPCQDISLAGDGKGLVQGARSGLFFEISRIIKEIRPTFVFLENVPAIRTRGLDTILLELTTLGYDCRWTIISAASIGAPHQRDRWFLLGSNSDCFRRWKQLRGRSWANWKNKTNIKHDGFEEFMADSIGERLEETWWKKPQYDSTVDSNWWATEPNVGRVVDGLPNRVDRIKGLGNSVVPAQAKKAFEILIGFEEKNV